VFFGGIRVKVVPSDDLIARELALVVPPILSSSCCCWRSATPWGLALFHHHSASRIFITQLGRNLRSVVIHKDDYQPCGGEKRAGLRPPPCPQLQGCSSSALGRRASRVGVPPSAWAGGPLLPPAFGGEGRSPALRRRQTPGTRSRPSEAPSAAACLVPRPRWLWCCLRRCLLPLGWGMAVRPPHGRRSRRAWVGHTHGFSRAVGRTGGSYKTSYAMGATTAFLDGIVLTPAVRTGARTFLRVLGRPPLAGMTLVHRWPLSSVLRWSPPLVRLPTAEVVASAGEIVSATCRQTSGSLTLMASLSRPPPPQPRLLLFYGPHFPPPPPP
jgi:hypothetical protein